MIKFLIFLILLVNNFKIIERNIEYKFNGNISINSDFEGIILVKIIKLDNVGNILKNNMKLVNINKSIRKYDILINYKINEIYEINNINSFKLYFYDDLSELKMKMNDYNYFYNLNLININFSLQFNKIEFNTFTLSINKNNLNEIPNININSIKYKFSTYLDNIYNFNNTFCKINCKFNIDIKVKYNSLLKLNILESKKIIKLKRNITYKFDTYKEKISLYKFNFKNIKKNEYIIVNILILKGKIQCYINPNFILEDLNKFLIKDITNNSKRLVLSYELIKKLLIENLTFYLEIWAEVDSKFIIKINKYKKFIGYLYPNIMEIDHLEKDYEKIYRVILDKNIDNFKLFVKILTGELSIKIFICNNINCLEKKLIEDYNWDYNIAFFKFKNICSFKKCHYEIIIKGSSSLDNYYKIITYNNNFINLDFNSQYYTYLQEFNTKKYNIKNLKNTSINIDCFYGNYLIEFYNNENLKIENNIFFEKVDCNNNFLLDSLKKYNINKFEVENLYIIIKSNKNTLYNINLISQINYKDIFHIINQLNFGIPYRGSLNKNNKEMHFSLFIKPFTINYHELIINLQAFKGNFILKVSNNEEFINNNKNYKWITKDNYLKIKEENLNLKDNSKIIITVQLDSEYSESLISSLEEHEFFLNAYYLGKKILLRPSVPFFDVISSYYNYFYFEVEKWMGKIKIYRNLENKSHYFCVYFELKFNKDEEIICDFKIKNNENVLVLNEKYINTKCLIYFNNNYSCKFNVIIFGLEKSNFGILFNYDNLAIKLIKNKIFNFSLDTDNLKLAYYCDINIDSKIYLSLNRYDIDVYNKIYNNMELKLDTIFPDSSNYDYENKLEDSNVIYFIYTNKEVESKGNNSLILLNIINKNHIKNEHISLQFNSIAKQIEKYYILNDYLNNNFNNLYFINNKEINTFLKIIVITKEGSLLDIKISILENNEHKIIYHKIGFNTLVIYLNEQELKINLHKNFYLNINSSIITHTNIYYINSEIEYFKIPFDTSKNLYLEKFKPIFLEIKTDENDIIIKYFVSGCQASFWARCNYKENNLDFKNFDWDQTSSELGGFGELILNSNHQKFCKNKSILLNITSNNNCTINLKLVKNNKLSIKLGDLFHYKALNKKLFYFNNPDGNLFELTKYDLIGNSKISYNCGYINSKNEEDFISLDNNINIINPNITNCKNINGTFTFLVNNNHINSENIFLFNINKPYFSSEVYSGIPQIGIWNFNQTKSFHFSTNINDVHLEILLKIDIKNFNKDILKLQMINNFDNILIPPINIKKIKRNKYKYTFNSHYLLESLDFFIYLNNIYSNSTYNYEIELNKNRFNLIKMNNIKWDYIKGNIGNIYQLFHHENNLFLNKNLYNSKIYTFYLDNFNPNTWKIKYIKIKNEIPTKNNLFIKFSNQNISTNSSDYQINIYNNTYIFSINNKYKPKKFKIKNLKLSEIIFNNKLNILITDKFYNLYISDNIKSIQRLKSSKKFIEIDDNSIKLLNPQKKLYSKKSYIYNYNWNFKYNKIYIVFNINNKFSSIFEIRLNKYHINLYEIIFILYFILIIVIVILIAYINKYFTFDGLLFKKDYIPTKCFSCKENKELLESIDNITLYNKIK